MLVIYGYFVSENTGALNLVTAFFVISVFRLVPAVNRLMVGVMNLKLYQYTIDDLLQEKSQEEENHTSHESIFKEGMNLRKVTFQFDGSNVPLFERVDLEIRKGDVVGIVGESGVGKSTLMKIMMGLIKPSSGEFMIDDIPLTNERIRAWQKQIGYVGQEPFIWTGSLKENIALGEAEEEFDQQRFTDSLKRASLKIYFEEWKENPDILLGEFGAQISQGQKQRIAIARALYKQAKVLFLDEATSALDQRTEKEILETIQHLSDKNFTIVIIAHRLSTLKHCNKMYELREASFYEKTL